MARFLEEAFGVMIECQLGVKGNAKDGGILGDGDRSIEKRDVRVVVRLMGVEREKGEKGF